MTYLLVLSLNFIIILNLNKSYKLYLKSESHVNAPNHNF